MVTMTERLTLWERKRLRRRIEKCEERGSLSASLFLDADCFFFYGTKQRYKGVLSVFFTEENEAEFAPAAFSAEKEILPALFQAALRECRRRSTEGVYTVADPRSGHSPRTECGARFSYAFSEYFLCCDTAELAREYVKEKETVFRRYEEPDGQIRCCLLREGKEVTECMGIPFDEGKGWYVYRLETKEEFRQKGFAERLLRAAAAEFAAAGAEKIRLQVSSKNQPAERLYRKLGFWTEEQRDYYKTEEL